MSEQMCGWAGKILRVDLSSGEITYDETSRYVPDYIGGKGIATKIAWDELRPGVGPFDEDNLIAFMTGPFAGTAAPASSRGVVCSCSPRAYPIEWWTSSNIGGDWTSELKFAGFDGIVVKGIADKPVYLLVTDGHAQICDASDLWGAGAVQAQERLREELGDGAVQTLAIGPAGEHLVRNAMVMHQAVNAAGSAGFGAVMGSKNLKAIAIRGTGGVRVADPKGFLNATFYVKDLVKSGPLWPSPVGGAPAPHTMPCTATCPFGCPNVLKRVPQLGEIPGSSNVAFRCVGSGLILDLEGMFDYPTPLIEDKYDGRIRFRSFKSLGPVLGSQLKETCDNLGLNAWQFLTLQAWLHFCVDNGIDELGGEKLAVNDPDFWFELIRKVAYREGVLGDALADDLMRAVEKLDVPEIAREAAHFQEPMWGYNDHRTGRALESQPSPIWVFNMLHWVTDTRDPMTYTHMSSFAHYWMPPHWLAGTENTSQEKLKKTYRDFFGVDGVLDAGFEPLDAKVKAAKWFSDRAFLKESLITCDWIFPRLLRGFNSWEELEAAPDYHGDVEAEAKMLAPLTGMDITNAQLEQAGERIRNLDRALQVRNYDRSRAIDETGEWYFELPEKSDGTKLDKPTFDRILEAYYQVRGWDEASGRPTRAKLEELGLCDVADELEAAGQLPK